ncbi:MAG TPA: hypothetical protein VGT03_08075 [Candidatus Acidoferrales bacterium]|nr:hypothetical protein [Candidatus Acidoferrales bacterium]
MSAKRIISLIVGVLAAVAAVWVLLQAVFLAHDYFTIQEDSRLETALAEAILLPLAGILLFEAYRFLRYFAQKAN